MIPHVNYIWGEEEEDIVHFLVKCKKLEAKRDDRLMNGAHQDPEEKLR